MHSMDELAPDVHALDGGVSLCAKEAFFNGGTETPRRLGLGDHVEGASTGEMQGVLRRALRQGQVDRRKTRILQLNVGKT
jgi:hypothetical protein